MENPLITSPIRRVIVVFDTVTPVLLMEGGTKAFVILRRGMTIPTWDAVFIELPSNGRRRYVRPIRDSFDGFEITPILFVQPLLVGVAPLRRAVLLWCRGFGSHYLLSDLHLQLV